VGDVDLPTLRYQLAGHRTLALSMLGRAQAAKQWLAKTEQLRAELVHVEPIDEQDLVATRARPLDACGEHPRARARPPPPAARVALERAALSGERHGWVFPDRQESAALWQMALKSGDSRVVRYAEKILAVLANGVAPQSIPSPSRRGSIPPATHSFPSVPPPS